MYQSVRADVAADKFDNPRSVRDTVRIKIDSTEIQFLVRVRIDRILNGFCPIIQPEIGNLKVLDCF